MNQKIFILIFSILFVTAPSARAQQTIDSFFDDTSTLLEQYVAYGLVDYAGLNGDQALLNALVEYIAEADRSRFSEDEDKAFLINAYNVLVLKTVLDHYPFQSPLDVPGFFDRIEYTVAGERLTLDGLEKGELFVQYPDARMHFVLVCAAAGCPEIIPTAYRPSTLEQQLDTQTERAMNNEKHVRIMEDQKKILVSELFSWYEADFKEEAPSIRAYIDAYRSTLLPEDYEIDYMPYDWQLNDKWIRTSTGEVVPAFDPSQPSGTPSSSDNLQIFTPSTLLLRGQLDIKVFNNLYTQTAFFNNNGSRTEANRRDTYFTGIIQITMGHSRTFNYGIDLYPKAVRVAGTGTSPFSVLQFETNSNARATLAAIAPKVKFAPFKKLPALALQASLYIPTASDLEGSNSGRPFLDYDDFQTWLQAFYDVPINNDFLAYLESGVFLRFDSNKDVRAHEMVVPLKAILNYFPTDRWTLYGLGEFTPSLNKQFGAYYTQFGVGAKFLLLPQVEIETLVTAFPLGLNKGAGQTYNIGLRFLR